MRIATRSASAVLVASAASASVDAFIPEASFYAAFGASRRAASSFAITPPTTTTICRSSYLDNLSSASSGSGGSSMSSVATAPPPPAASTAPPVGSYADAISEVCDADSPQPSEDCAVAITSYLDSLSTGESRPTMDAAAAISSYLDALSAGTSVTASSGPAVASYLDALSSRTVEPPSTGAISSYIDALSTREIMAPANADAITTYLGSLAACDGDNSKSEDCASAITSYLDTLGGDAGYSAEPPPPPPPPPAMQSSGQQQQQAAASGGSYLESLAACEGGAQRSEECATAITSYLDALSTGSAQPSSEAAATITSYLDALSAGAAAARSKPPPPPPRAPPSPVAETIEALPETKVSESVTSIAPLVMPYVEEEVSELATSTSPQVETYTGTSVQVFEDSAHVTKEPTTLRLMEKMWFYSAPGYSIRDQHGVEWFEYVARSLSVRAHRQVRNPLHETIFFMKEKLFQWAPTQYRNPIYHKNDSIYQSLKVVGGRALGRAKLRSNVRDVNTGEVVKLVLEGDVVDFDATIYIGEPGEGGQPVARIYRPLVNGRKVAFGGVHQYQVDIAPGIDAAMIVAMCISFDELKNDRDHGH